jgi:hypothetical protein
MSGLLNPYWIVGFVDGEGCFYIGINRHLKSRMGFQVLPEFRVVQAARDVELLYRLKSFFGCGQVVLNKGKNKKGNGFEIYEYRVRGLNQLLIIIEFFDKYELQTVKRYNYLRFRRWFS